MSFASFHLLLLAAFRHAARRIGEADLPRLGAAKNPSARILYGGGKFYTAQAGGKTKKVGSELLAALQGPHEGGVVGKLQMAPHRDAVGKAGDLVLEGL